MNRNFAVALPLVGWALHTSVLTVRLDRARRDPLTGLVTRDGFTAAATSAITRRPTLVALVDLDGFKQVNDTYGHAAGDAVLAATAARLRGFAGRFGVAARFGGDEFTTATYVNPRDPGDAAAELSWLAHALSQPVPYQGAELRVGASVGGCVALPGTPLSQALTAADTAMYAAKQSGGGWDLATGHRAGTAALPAQRRWSRSGPPDHLTIPSVAQAAANLTRKG